MVASQSPRLSLKPVDAVQVLVVMDNYSDVLLPGDGRIARQPLAPGGNISTDTLLAEHDLSLLVSAQAGGQETQVLLDAGYSPVGVPHNLDLMGVGLDGVEAVVLSHGHMDHFGALPEVLRRVGRPVPLVLHPAAKPGDRILRHPLAGDLSFPRTPLEDFEAAGAQLTWAREPYLGGEGRWAASGEVARTTDFETGMPGAMRDNGQGYEPDAILDDMYIVLNLAGKGLVVISGCAHAGIVNTVRHARALTGVDQVHAVIGGFHLTGPAFEPIIGRTVEEMRAFAPEVVMPMHCTGRKAMAAFEEGMPDQFVLSSVGSRLTL